VEEERRGGVGWEWERGEKRGGDERRGGSGREEERRGGAESGREEDDIDLGVAHVIDEEGMRVVAVAFDPGVSMHDRSAESQVGSQHHQLRHVALEPCRWDPSVESERHKSVIVWI
jgi:hypothetical protein